MKLGKWGNLDYNLILGAAINVHCDLLLVFFVIFITFFSPLVGNQSDSVGMPKLD